MKKTHMDWLQANEACAESIDWVRQGGIQSLEEAWYTCQRGDWLLWMANKLNVDRRKLVLCGALSAHTIIQYMEDRRSRDAVRAAFLWARGKATDKELDSAWHKASAAFHVAEGNSAWAARVALSAIEAVDNDNIRDYVAAAAAAASWLTGATGGDIKDNLLRTANIARKALTDEVMKKIKEIK